MDDRKTVNELGLLLLTLNGARKFNYASSKYVTQKWAIYAIVI